MQRDRVLLFEMVTAIERVIDIASGRTVAEVELAPDRRDALLWNFTVLGEAAGQLSTELREQHPAAPWSDAIRTRNRIVHGYWSVDIELLMSIARDDLPAFRDQIAGILGESGR